MVERSVARGHGQGGAQFPSKDHLLDAVASRIEEKIVVVMSAAAPPTVPLRGAAPDLVTALLSMTAHSPALRVLSERAGTGHTEEDEAPLVRGWIVERAATAQQAGEVAVVGAGLDADLGFALIRAGMTSITTRPTPDEEDGQLPSLLAAGCRACYRLAETSSPELTRQSIALRPESGRAYGASPAAHIYESTMPTVAKDPDMTGCSSDPARDLAQ